MPTASRRTNCGGPTRARHAYTLDMRAHVLTKQAPIDTAPLALRDIPDPLPAPGEVRVRVRACGVCRTDLHVIEGLK